MVRLGAYAPGFPLRGDRCLLNVAAVLERSPKHRDWEAPEWRRHGCLRPLSAGRGASQRPLVLDALERDPHLFPEDQARLAHCPGNCALKEKKRKESVYKTFLGMKHC